jgi:asparagine N-glycosylation enzyme membrane subunit Stt3
VRLVLFMIAFATVATVRALPMWLATGAARAPFTYQAANGTTYPYLIGQDSYSWVRKAHNYLTTGSACDVRTADDCRDALRHGPVGSTMPYADSLHIAAIAWLHRLLSLFDARRPIEASALWLQVVVGALGVIPAWLVGSRLGGAWGGFMAALLIGLQPAFLHRSLGADNDVWNVVLPLCATSALLVALDDGSTRRRLAWAALAAAFVGLHAAIWSGWALGFVSLAGGALVCSAWAAIRDWRRAPGTAMPSEARTLIAVCGVFVIVAALMAEPGDGWSELSSNVGSALRHVGLASAPATELDAHAAEFPKTMRFVGELMVLDPGQLVTRLGGASVLLGAVLGIAAMLGVRIARPDLVPSGAARGAVVVGVWLAVALVQSLRAQRFAFLAVAPIGLAFGGGAGAVIGLARRRVPTRAAGWLAAAVLLVPVGMLVQSGVENARAAVPDVTDAWWDSLRGLRAKAPADALVYAWWQYGYWIEYGAERGVTADGSSLRTRIPHWLGRALMASDFQQGVGLLRMLGCGSDAFPEAEGARGAYERLRAAGADGLEAYDLLLALAATDRAGAERLLDARGWDPARRAAILEATHCTPPPAYLMLSNHPLHQGDIRYEGSWDPHRAAVAHRLRSLPETEAITTGVRNLGLDEAQVRTMYETVRKLRSDDDVEKFIAPMLPYYTDWVSCPARGAARLVCDINSSGRLQRFTVTGPVGQEQGTVTLRENGVLKDGVPALLLVVDGSGIRAVPQAGTILPEYGMLVDETRSRVLFGPPNLIGSLMTRLMKLDGRGLSTFEKVDERSAAGETVTTWRIVWPPES